MGVFKKIADYTGALHSVDPTGHSHSTSESWLSTIVSSLQTAINGKASTSDLHGLENLVQELEDSKADVNHTQAISTITGLQSALDGKLDSEVVEMEATALNPIVVNDIPVGKLILIAQDERAIEHLKLKQLIVKESGSTEQLNFHLNSGELTNTYFLVRRFAWTGGTLGYNHHFIEVVGAWD